MTSLVRQRAPAAGRKPSVRQPVFVGNARSAVARPGPVDDRLPTARPRLFAGDRGSVTLELAIVFPVLLLIVTALVQYALWFHARSLALAAAQQGVAIARAYDSTPAAGRDSALAFIADHGSDTLLDPTATTGSPGPGQVQVVVTGRSLSVLPGVAGPAISQSAAGPVERFTTAGAP